MDTNSQEITKRHKQYESAIASVRMEGFEFTKDDLALFEKIIQGEITEDEAINDLKKQISEWKKTRPEIFIKEGEPSE
jgi:hypothetical protein